MWFPGLVRVLLACFILSRTAVGYPPRYAHRRGQLHQYHHAHHRKNCRTPDREYTLSAKQNATSGVLQKQQGMGDA